jgi:adenine/guanine phosphoribosyltransferase-like PRPP-binding protein
MIADYLRYALDRERRSVTVLEIVTKLKRIDFGTLVVRGLSGLLVGPIVAERMQKELVAIRKPNDGSTSDYSAEGNPTGAFVILDDLIASGDTVCEILKTMTRLYSGHRCAGSYLYVERRWLAYSALEDRVELAIRAPFAASVHRTLNSLRDPAAQPAIAA